MTDQQDLGLHQPLSRDESAHFWRDPGFQDLDCLVATFTRHRYAPHTHATYVVGIIEAGCEEYTIGGVLHRVRPGDFCFVLPDQVHDGVPYAGGYRYRTIYPSASLIRGIAEDVHGRSLQSLPMLGPPVAHDPVLAAEFGAAHVAMERRNGRLESDERMISVLAKILARHASIAPGVKAGDEPLAVARVRDHLEANLAEDTGLEELAQVAGLSRFHLIRVFRRATGLTPHAYLLDRRVRRARELLGRGLAPADVAAELGFSDQSHLTRSVKQRLGVTPSVLRPRAA